MIIHLTAPLTVQTAMGGVLDMLPVAMESKPSNDPQAFLAFLKTNGKRIPVGPVEALKIQRYMHSNGTEAISEFGLTRLACQQPFKKGIPKTKTKNRGNAVQLQLKTRPA